jgi:hypothetical protein
MAQLVEVVDSESCAVFALCHALPALCAKAKCDNSYNAEKMAEACDDRRDETSSEEGTESLGLRALAVAAYRVSRAGSIPEVR